MASGEALFIDECVSSHAAVSTAPAAQHPRKGAAVRPNDVSLVHWDFNRTGFYDELEDRLQQSATALQDIHEFATSRLPSAEQRRAVEPDREWYDRYSRRLATFGSEEELVNRRNRLRAERRAEQELQGEGKGEERPLAFVDPRDLVIYDTPVDALVYRDMKPRVRDYTEDIFAHLAAEMSIAPPEL